MLLCVWVSSKRVAASCTASTIKAPRPNAPMTNAAFSQCASRSDNGQTDVALFIGQRAGLDFECVVDEWNAEHHAEVRALNSAFRHEGDRPALGGGIGRHI